MLTWDCYELVASQVSHWIGSKHVQVDSHLPSSHLEVSSHQGRGYGWEHTIVPLVSWSEPSHSCAGVSKSKYIESNQTTVCSVIPELSLSSMIIVTHQITYTSTSFPKHSISYCSDYPSHCNRIFDYTSAPVGGTFPSRHCSPAYWNPSLVDPAAALPRTVLPKSTSKVAGKSTAWLSRGLHNMNVLLPQGLMSLIML